MTEEGNKGKNMERDEKERFVKASKKIKIEFCQGVGRA